MPKPTKAELDERLADYREAYANFRAEARDDEAVVLITSKWVRSIIPAYLKGFPKRFVPKVPPIAKIAIDVARNTVMVGEEPEANVALPQGRISDDNLEKRRKEQELFYKAILYNIAHRTTMNPFSEMLNQLYGPGMAGYSFAFVREKWPEYPSERTKESLEEYERAKRDAWCWDVRVEHCQRVLFDSNADPPEDVFLEDEIPARRAKRLYPSLDIVNKGKVKRIVYCSKDWYGVWIADQPVYGEDGVVPNPMGIFWFEQVVSGLGQLDETGDLQYLYKGLIRDARDVIAMLVADLNISEAVKFQTAFSPIHAKGKTAEEAEEAVSKVEWGPMSFVSTADTIQFERLFDGNNLEGVVWNHEQMDRWLQVVFGPTILRGQYEDQTATGAKLRVNLAETPFQSAKVANEQAIANMLRKMGQFYKYELALEPGDKVHLPYKDGATVSIDPKDLIDDVVISVNLKPTTPEERAFTAAQDKADLELHAIDMAEYRRRQGIENGERMDRGILVELLKYHPAVVQAAASVIQQRIAPSQLGVPAAGMGGPATMGQAPDAGAQVDQRMPNRFEAPMLQAQQAMNPKPMLPAPALVGS